MATNNKPQAVVNEENRTFTLAAVDSAEPDRKTVLSEGTRQELENNGHAVSPFTGALLVGSPSNFREVEEAEYTKAARESSKRRNATKDSNLL